MTEIKRKKRRDAKKVTRQKGKWLSDADNMEILRLHRVEKLSYSVIGQKFGVGKTRICQILKKLNGNIKISGETIIYTPDEVIKRREMDKFERITQIEGDALEVAEMTLSIAKHKIKTIQQAVIKGDMIEDGKGTGTIDFDKLTRLLNVALPYILQKKEIAKDSSGKKKPVTKLHKLMIESKDKAI